MPSSADAEANFTELLSFSRHGAQRDFRSTKIRSLTDEDIAQVISIGTKRKFAREGLEKILLFVLDVAAQEANITSEISIDRAGDVKVKLEECMGDSESIACKNARPMLLLWTLIWSCSGSRRTGIVREFVTNSISGTRALYQTRYRYLGGFRYHGQAREEEQRCIC